MLIKLGVTIQYLSRSVRRKLNTIDAIFTKYNSVAVVTSTNEGNHMPSSLHYSNNAIDFRKPASESFDKILAELRSELGKKFDVVNEANHIHIEFDPKK